MRIAPLILFLVACGCDFSTSGPGLNKTVRSGKNRLTVKKVSTGPVPGAPGATGIKFDSLVWEREEGDFWRERAVITEDAFQAGTDKKRSVTDIHSFDPRSGIAVIKVAEESAPQTNGTTVSVHVSYSWREWNLTSNAEVRVLRICKDAFDAY